MFIQGDATSMIDLINGWRIASSNHSRDIGFVNQLAELQITDSVRVVLSAFISQQLADIIIGNTLLNQFQGDKRAGRIFCPLILHALLIADLIHLIEEIAWSSIQ